jgi:hypothetical protein
MKFLLFAVLLQASPGADGSPPHPDPGPDSIDVVETARRLHGASLPLTAGDLLSRYLSQSRDGAADPKTVLLAARAYADGRAWSAVLRLLLGQPWLGEMDAGAGLLEVGRAFAGLDSLIPRTRQRAESRSSSAPNTPPCCPGSRSTPRPPRNTRPARTSGPSLPAGSVSRRCRSSRARAIWIEPGASQPTSSAIARCPKTRCGWS